MITSRNWILPALLTVGLHLSMAGPAQAATFSTNSFFDAFVTTGPTANLSANNYGAAGALGVAAPGLAKGEFQSVLQFDLAGARSSFDSQFGTGQWTIQSASLQLTATPTNNIIFNPTAAGLFQTYWMPNDSWIEGTGTPAAPAATGITFSSLQSTFSGPGDDSLGTFSFNGATSGAATYPLNLTSGLVADLLAGNDISLRLAAADSNVSYLFNSRNFATAANRPLLTVVVVPEPGTALLGSLGIALLAGWRPVVRRRNL